MTDDLKPHIAAGVDAAVGLVTNYLTSELGEAGVNAVAIIRAQSHLDTVATIAILAAWHATALVELYGGVDAALAHLQTIALSNQ